MCDFLTDGHLMYSSHPSDEKDTFPHNISTASLGSLLGHHSTNHISQNSEPNLTDPLMGGDPSDQETKIDIEREVRCVHGHMEWGEGWAMIGCHCNLSNVSPQRESLPSLPTIQRSKSKHELKLLEKIPENAEASVVLVGECLWKLLI